MNGCSVRCPIYRKFANKKTTQECYVTVLKPSWFCCQLELYFEKMAFLTIFAIFYKNKWYHLSRKILDFTILSPYFKVTSHLNLIVNPVGELTIYDFIKIK
jgi:hypothetical protein